MAKKPSIAIVGAGRLGTGLALALKAVGYPVSEIVSREGSQSRQKARKLARSIGAQPVVLPKQSLDSDLLWICVPDREIGFIANEIATKKVWDGKAAFHSSGALASDELTPLRKRGVAVAAVHPLMTFVASTKPSLKGVPFGLEGDVPALKLARSIVRDLGGSTFLLPKRAKVAYHAWGAFLSPLLIALLVGSERVAQSAGLGQAQARKMMVPILKQTIANYSILGPTGAFSGPIVRGDLHVVKKHLEVLRRTPEARDVYLALARVAIRHLPVEQRQKLRKALTR